jgi:uncharacterized protein
MNKRIALIVALCWLCVACVEAQAQAQGQSAPARAQFIYVLRVAPAFHTAQAWGDKDNAAVGKHFERLAQATAQGQVILAGRTTEPLAETFGIVIFEADDEQSARQFMQSDPAVVAGLMSATLHPYSVALQRKR